MLSLTASSIAYSLVGQWENAVAEAQEALRRGEEFSDDSVVSFAAWVISLAYSFQGDSVRAVTYGELGVQKAPTPANKAWAQGALGYAWCRAGEPHRGVEALAQVVSLGRVTRWRPNDFFMICLGEGYWLSGDLDKARQTLEELLGIAESCGMRFHTASAHRLLGEIALSDNISRPDPARAALHFERSIAILREINAENELAHAYAGYGLLHKHQGSFARARDYLTKALEVFSRLGTLLEPDKVRAELAELPPL
jgi:tetratricopeptide (TPR) repeat protein